jgi:hypothetical protein
MVTRCGLDLSEFTAHRSELDEVTASIHQANKQVYTEKDFCPSISCLIPRKVVLRKCHQRDVRQEQSHALGEQTGLERIDLLVPQSSEGNSHSEERHDRQMPEDPAADVPCLYLQSFEEQANE